MIELLRHLVLGCGVVALLVLASLGAVAVAYIIRAQTQELPTSEAVTTQLQKTMSIVTEIGKTISEIAPASPEVAYGLTLAMQRLINHSGTAPLDASASIEVIKSSILQLRSTEGFHKC